MMGFVGLLKFAVKCLYVLAWPVFGLGYPICASIQAIETNSHSDTQKLITYWVSISVVLLFEHAFQLEWLTFWPYIKLIIVGCLVLPYFDGSLYVYKHLVHPCLSMDPRIITCQFNKLEELFFKKDDFLVEAKRYMKENGSDALEDLIASAKKSAEPNVVVNKIRAAAAQDWPEFEQPKLPLRFKDGNAVEKTKKTEVASTKQPNFEQPKLPVRFKDSNAVEIMEKKEVGSTIQQKFEQAKLPIRFKDSNAVEITERIEVASTEQLNFEQPKLPVRFNDSNTVEIREKKEVASIAQLQFGQLKLPVRFKDSNAIEIIEKKEVASTKQLRQIESNIDQRENRTFPPLENINTAAATVGGKDPYEILFPEKVQTVWTCAICQVTAQSETVFNSHLQGKRHKAACEQLKVKNLTPEIEVSPASVGKKSDVTTATAGIDFTCVECQLTLKSQIDMKSHLQGKRHMKACELQNSKNQASKNNVSLASMGKKPNLPESKPEKYTISNTTPENRIHGLKDQGKEENLMKSRYVEIRKENLMKSRYVEIRNSNWWCTICNVSCTGEGNMTCHLKGSKHLSTTISALQCAICNVSCTSEGDMHCHLNGNKHLASMRELDGLGCNGHA